MVHPSVRKNENLPYSSEREKSRNRSVNQSIGLRFAVSRQRIVNAGSERNLKYVRRAGGNCLCSVIEHFRLSAVATPCMIFSFMMGMLCRYPGVKTGTSPDSIGLVIRSLTRTLLGLLHRLHNTHTRTGLESLLGGVCVSSTCHWLAFIAIAEYWQR